MTLYSALLAEFKTKLVRPSSVRNLQFVVYFHPFVSLICSDKSKRKNTCLISQNSNIHASIRHSPRLRNESNLSLGNSDGLEINASHFLRSVRPVLMTQDTFHIVNITSHTKTSAFYKFALLKYVYPCTYFVHWA